MVDTIKGDIRDLYAYYRLSDHASTCLTLKNKTLSKEAVWFEGYMDFSFKCCTFDKPIYWGVEGTRLEGDTRGTDENDDTFPIYGSNGLNFDGCTFTENAPVTIEANCVAVFINCEFQGENVVTLGNNTRVEFIDCEFNNWRFDILDFCDVRMRRCEWASPLYHINITNGSQLTCNDCEYNSAATYSMEISADSKVRLTNHTPVDVSTSIHMYKVTDKSSLDMYNFTTLNSATQVLIAEDSKVKWRTISEVVGVLNTVELNDDSQLFCKDVDSIISGSLTAIVMDNSTLRMKNNALIQGLIHGIEATESKVIIQDFNEIIGINSDACWGDKTEFRVFNGVTIINQANAAGVYLTGESKSLFKGISDKIQGLFYGLNVNDKAEIIVDNCTLIRGVVMHGIIYAGDPIIECVTVDTIKGLIHGITGDTATLRVMDTSTEIYGETEHGLSLTNTLYDFKNIDFIHGLLKGAILNNCKGVLQEVREIQGETEEGCVINGMAGPTEWINVQKLWSPVMQGLVFNGDAAQSRFSGIQDIHSETLEGIIWTQSGGIAVFSNFGEIYSIPESGMEIHISDGAVLEAIGGQKIYSVDKHAIEGDNAGNISFSNIQEISSTNGDIVKLTGSGADSVTKFKFIDLMTTEQAPDDAISILGNGQITLQNIPEIKVNETAQSVVKLESLNAGYGNIKILDCKSITAEKCVIGLSVAKSLITDIVGIEEACEIKCNETEETAFKCENTNLYLANYSEISCSGGEGKGVVIDTGDKAGAKIQLIKVDKIEAQGHAMDLKNKGHIEVVDVAEIISKKEDGIRMEGEGVYSFVGEQAPIKVSGKDITKYTIYGTASKPAVISLANVETQESMGKIDFTQFSFRSYSSVFNGDFILTDCSGEAHKSEFNTSVKLIGSRFSFYDSPIDLVAKPGQYFDFEVDLNSSVYLFKSAISGSGDFVPNGVVHGDIEEIDVDFKGTTGVVLLNKTNILKPIDTTSDLTFNKVTTTSNVKVEDNTLVFNNFEGEGTFETTNASMILNNFESAGTFQATGSSMVFNGFEVTGAFTSTANTMIGNNLTVLSTFTDTNSTLLWNKSSIQSVCDFGSLAATILNRPSFGTDVIYGLDSGVICNMLKFVGSGELSLDEETASIFNHLTGLQGDLEINPKCAAIFNRTEIAGTGKLIIYDETATIFNDLTGLANNLEINANCGTILNRVVGDDEETEIIVQGSSGIMAPWISGLTLSLLDENSAIIASHAEIADAVVFSANSSGLLASTTIGGTTTLDAKSALALIGGQYDKPTGDGVILEMGPSVYAVRTSKGEYTPVNVAGLHIHANSDGNKNVAALTNKYSHAFVAAGQDAAGYEDTSFIYGYSQVVVEGEGVPRDGRRGIMLHLRNGRDWVNGNYGDGYAHIALFNDMTNHGVEISGGKSLTSPDIVSIRAHHFTATGNPWHNVTPYDMGIVWHEVDTNESWFRSNQKMSFKAPVIDISASASVSGTDYTSSILLNGTTGDQYRYSSETMTDESESEIIHTPSHS